MKKLLVKLISFGFLRFPIAIALSITTLWLLGLTGFSLAVSFMGNAQDTRKTDALVVLTGGEKRVQTGFELLDAGYAKKLFISGVNPNTGLSAIMRMAATSEKDYSCCITLGHEADNTIENAAETAKWAKENDIHSLRLITATYHIPRAYLEFNKAMPDIEIILHPVHPESFDILKERGWHLVLDEYTKSLFVLIRTLLEKS